MHAIVEEKGRLTLVNGVCPIAGIRGEVFEAEDIPG